MGLVSWTISLSVLSAVLTCAVVILLFSASLSALHFAAAIAWLFIGSMIAIGLAFAIFLIETQMGSRAVRVRSEILEHMAEDRD
jgi:nucleoside permease NupC